MIRRGALAPAVDGVLREQLAGLVKVADFK